jgi:mRNA surveillance protein pelota
VKYKIEKNTLILMPEDEEDLFKLTQIIEKDDIIEGKDLRKVKISNDVVKKPFYIVMKVEEIVEGKPLRVKGIVLNEHEEFPKGSYHSFTIDVGKEFKLTKKAIPSFIKEILEEKKKEPIKAILLDDEKAEFFVIKDKTIDKIKEIKYKDNEGERSYELLKKEIEKENWDNFVIAGPGVFKEELAKLLKDKNFIIASTSTIGFNGIKELLKRKELDKLFKDLKTKKEEEIIDNFLVELKKEGNVSYGKELFELAEIGAIKELFINSDLIFKNNNKEEKEKIINLINKVEESNGKVHLIETDTKKKLKGFGNMIAFLRFKI